MASVEDGKTLVVLYPSPGMGHLVSMIELGKLFVAHGLAVTIVTVDRPYNTGYTAAFINRALAANPSIFFHRLPPVTLLPNPSPYREALAIDLLRLSNPNILEFLHGTCPRALVVDFFYSDVLDVAAELSLPCYFFFTSPANFLSVFLHLPAFHSKTTRSFKDMGKQPLDFPGVPPIPADHMPYNWLDRNDNYYKGCLHNINRFPGAQGIIVNTFEALEERAMEAINAGSCVTDGRRTPPIYSIGPLITSDRGQNSNREECIAWLDKQPPDSVVFLCFGSLGVFSAEQLKEIAVGLERSEKRFLWVVRSPPSQDPSKQFEKPPEPDLEALLPSGFPEQTRERERVVKSWAPQVEVLKHKSVGGFVCHCGWNSVLEAITAGVPMIGWPLYAEQRVYKVFLVEEVKLAVVVDGYDRGLVDAEEVEAKIRWLMESEGGRELRDRIAVMKEKATDALREGGSSHAALLKLLGEWKCKLN